MKDNETIFGGAFQLARQIFSSEIWLEKPATWGKIWIYILGKVNHKKKGKFNRGEGFFNLTEEKRQIGIDISYNTIREAMRYFRKSEMIDTTKTTRGVIIKVLNYNKFQTLDNFQNTTKHKTETQPKQNRNTMINKNDKNVKNNKNTRLDKPTKRKSFKYPKEWYNQVITKYQLLKGIQLQGEEFKPIQQVCKTMFMSNRTPKQIISCMEWIANSENEAYQSWTIRTIKIKLPEFLAGKLNL